MPVHIRTNPESLNDLKPGCFYLELIGECEPKLNPTAAEVTLGHESKDDRPEVPIYEFLWNLSHLDSAGSMATNGERPRDFDTNLKASLEVTMLFDGMIGWRTTEPICTVKFMSPAPEGGKLAKLINKDLKNAATVAGLVPGGGTASKWMDAAAGLSMSSIPQEGDYKWSVTKTAQRTDNGIASGVTWHIPREMVTNLSGRLTGGLAVGFLPALNQEVPEPRKEGGHGGSILLKIRIAGRPRGRILGKLKVVDIPTNGALSLPLTF
jgi:hypothetical protein